VAERYGVLRPVGSSERAIFLIDKQGVIRYIDIHDDGQQPDNQVLFDCIREIDPEAATREPREKRPAAVVLPHGGTVMYCTAWCHDCKKARKWFQIHQLPYTEVDITSTPGAAEQVRRWAHGNLTTPTFEIDGTILVEFDESRLREVLQLKD
jgi:glutaredoxin